MTETILDNYKVAGYYFYRTLYNGVTISTYNTSSGWIIYYNGKLVRGQKFSNMESAIRYLQVLADNAQ